jgi:hypothetical protein
VNPLVPAAQPRVWGYLVSVWSNLAVLGISPYRAVRAAGFRSLMKIMILAKLRILRLDKQN